jgi:hypothetical protein
MDSNTINALSMVLNHESTDEVEELKYHSDWCIKREYLKRIQDGFIPPNQDTEKPDDYVDDKQLPIKDFPTLALLDALKYRDIESYQNNRNDVRFNEDYSNSTQRADNYAFYPYELYERHLDKYYDSDNDVFLIQEYKSIQDDDYMYFKLTPLNGEYCIDTFSKIKRRLKSHLCSGCGDSFLGLEWFTQDELMVRFRNIIS